MKTREPSTVGGSCFDVLARELHRRQARAKGQAVDPNPVGAKERIGGNEKRIRASLKRPEDGRDVLRSPDFECDHFDAELAGRCLGLGQMLQGDETAGVGQYRQSTQARHSLAQELDLLAGKIG